MVNADRKVYSVSELTEEVKDLLEYNLDNVYITGEVSNFKKPSSGHFYFTLKDDNAQIKAVMFRQTNMYLRFAPKDGMQILGSGRVSVYEPQGIYQIIFDYIEPAGVGALKQAYDDLIHKLKEEGLFDDDKKKTFPSLVRRVGVITSPSGAAIRDFITVATRRFNNIHIILYPVKVQGEGAAEEIVKGIGYFNRAKNVDTIVITRGGGSFEDLFCFSEEVVARAIFASELPTVSAVGHEIDTSISDFVADLSAPTPSAAAEMIVLKKDELEYKISHHVESLAQNLEYHIDDMKDHISLLMQTIGQPKRFFENLSIKIDNLVSRLTTLVSSNMSMLNADYNLKRDAIRRAAPVLDVTENKKRLHMLVRILRCIAQREMKFNRYALNGYSARINFANPRNLLKKGYSVTSSMETNNILKSVEGVKKGALLGVKLGEGSLECKVTKIYKK